jgi:guanylate kinase
MYYLWSNADRPRRDNEPEDAYNFITKEELDLLEKERKLAEEIVFTGYSRKATSKSEILKLFDGENLIWRVDPSLASKIAKGDYFERYFCV